MTLCIAGKNNIAVDAMEFVLKTGLVLPTELVASCNQNDNGEDDFQRSYRKFCRSKGVEVVDLSELEAEEELLFISLEYDRIIPVERMQSERLFNMHFSLLPRYRGMYTAVWPILNGDNTAGVTLHRIDAGIDTGEIIAQDEFVLTASMTSRDLYLQCIEHGTALFKATISDLLTQQCHGVPQAVSGASYFSKSSINFDQIRIDLNKTAWEVHNQLRAFSFREYQLPSVLGLTIRQSEILPSRSSERPGKIVAETKDYIDLATIDFDVRCYIDG